MKSITRNMTLGIALCVATILGAGTLVKAGAERIVILHTNDTHSQIEPDASGAGGVLQRKAVIDSVRAAEKNVILVDAGDMVQGSLYFKYFHGEVEYPVMNMMDYDIRILGNHEFDNGLHELARYYKDVKGARLSASYDFSGTELDGIFTPYVIKKVGGKRIGFIGLNVDPASLIAKKAYEGMKFKEIIPVANETAAYLRNKEKCDMVVAVTHIGAVKESEKTTDYELAAASRDIDIIIGGHSHTVIRPGEGGDYPSVVMNAEGRPVLVTQTGKYGKYVGEIVIDTDDFATRDARGYDYSLIPVTDRFPEARLDKKIARFLEPYKVAVDSINNNVIAQSPARMDADSRTGAYPNFISDLVFDYAIGRADSLRAAGVEISRPDFAIMNVGGIRADMPEGDVTEGKILSTFPFDNRIVICRIKGSDVADAMRVAARKGGEGVSRNIRVISDSDGIMEHLLLNGTDIDPEKIYTYATIDYLAGGNDDLLGLGKGEIVWTDDVEYCVPVLTAIKRMGKRGQPVEGDPLSRFIRR